MLATRTVNAPTPGSDEVNRAYEEGWVGAGGYVKADGQRQRHAIAFLGDTIDSAGKKLTEVFIADLPEDVTRAGAAPLQGTATTLPSPPREPRSGVSRSLATASFRAFRVPVSGCVLT
ncbi:hypothetical protein GCM10022631_15750 [Deinococcus rubellus]|uniref:hypothetical protein n=1 Tax=Deinococcus rubellus TaxID=1889240 RepID=UPI0031E67D55